MSATLHGPPPPPKCLVFLQCFLKSLQGEARQAQLELVGPGLEMTHQAPTEGE